MKINLLQLAKLYDTTENDIPCIIGIQRGNTIFTKRLSHVSDILAQGNAFVKMQVSDFYVMENHLMITAKDI